MRDRQTCPLNTRSGSAPDDASTRKRPGLSQYRVAMTSGRVVAVRTFQAAFWTVWSARVGLLVRDGLHSISRPTWLVVVWLIVSGLAAFRPDLFHVMPIPEGDSDISGEADPQNAP